MNNQLHFDSQVTYNENNMDSSPVHSDGVVKTTLTMTKQKYEENASEKAREKIIRQPKKLEETHYQTKSEEFTKDVDKNGNALHKEHDFVTFISPGLDYSKSKYQKAAEQECSSPTPIKGSSKWSKSSSSSASSPPVNKIIVDKIAPPEITKSVRSIFERGTFHDIHEIQKLNVENDPLAEGGIYENEPVVLDGVIRGTDVMSETNFDSGYASNIRTQWENQPEFIINRDPIKIDACNPVIAENEPASLAENIVRGTMISYEKPILDGVNLKERMSKLKETKPLEKKEIKLIEDGYSSETILENQPLIRSDVIRESDCDKNAHLQNIHIKDIKSNFTDYQERTFSKAPIIIDRSSATIIENEPVILDGVAREGDLLVGVVSTSVDAKAMREKWLHISSDSSDKSKRPFEMDLDPHGGIILESTPQVRSDIVRCDDVLLESASTEIGHSKKLADRFTHWNDDKPKHENKIFIDQTQGCILENQPEERTDVIKSGGPTGWEIDFQAGHTKNLKEKWCSAAQEADTPKGKPAWQLELENAKESGIFENEPQQIDGVIRECDVMQNSDVPVQTKNLKNLWLNKEAENESEMAARRSSQPQVCNKPKRVLHDFKPRIPTPDSSDESKNEIDNNCDELKPDKKIKKKSKKKNDDIENSDSLVGFITSEESEDNKETTIPEFIAIVQIGSNRAKASMFGERKLTRAEKERLEAERIAREEEEHRRLEEEKRLAEELKLKKEEEARRLAKRRPDAWIKHRK